MSRLRSIPKESGASLLEILVVMFVAGTMAAFSIFAINAQFNHMDEMQTVKDVKNAATTVEAAMSAYGPITDATNINGSFTITNGEDGKTTSVNPIDHGKSSDTVKYSIDLDEDNPNEYVITGTMYYDSGSAKNYALLDSKTGEVDSGQGEAPGSPASTEQVTQSAAKSDSKSSALWWQIPVGVVGGLVVLIGGWFGGRFAFKKTKTNRALTTNNVMQWQRLIDAHNEVRRAWSEYEMDIVRLIDFPTMTDMTDDFTVKLHHALDRAHRLAPESAKKAAVHNAIGSDFEAAVNDLKTAFAAAESHAKKVSWSNFSAVERKRLRRAKDLLAMAYDRGASPSERQVAYKQALKELDGLIVPPAVTLAALEQKVTLLLEAAPSGNTVDLSDLLTKKDAQPITA